DAGTRLQRLVHASSGSFYGPGGLRNTSTVD
ncbi:hypothetical protein ABH924_004609, partial [Arthrobacter sp. GAS37]